MQGDLEFNFDIFNFCDNILLIDLLYVRSILLLECILPVSLLCLLSN